jgi:hypothetical protein
MTNLVLRLAPVTAFCVLVTIPTTAFAQQRGAAPAPRVAAPAKAAAPKAPAQVGKPVAPPASPVKAAALAWAKERNLPVREIEVGPPERRVKRLFVPVTTENWKSFEETFSSGPNRLMLKLKDNDNHLMPVVDKTYHLWARPSRGYYDEDHEHSGPRAPAMVVTLDDAETQHVRQWFTHRAAQGDVLWSMDCGHACMDFIGNIEVAPGADGTNTLRPIPINEVQQAAGGNVGWGYNAVKGGASTKVPMGKKLFDVLGIARSKDGRNMTYNVIHAASDKVEVVGIPVGPDEGGQVEKRVIREKGRVFVRDVVLHGAAIERFEKMTDDEILGPLPPQGVQGVARPVK